jgi:hypothetical protein|mmetsp:Transcript_475/g.695  ORF Transcript_475/g.695 Transcript_475/m.695 type:complete len:107 (-) Transcript_475:311-631(-)
MYRHMHRRLCDRLNNQTHQLNPNTDIHAHKCKKKTTHVARMHNSKAQRDTGMAIHIFSMRFNAPKVFNITNFAEGKIPSPALAHLHSSRHDRRRGEKNCDCTLPAC